MMFMKGHSYRVSFFKQTVEAEAVVVTPDYVVLDTVSEDGETVLVPLKHIAKVVPL